MTSTRSVEQRPQLKPHQRLDHLDALRGLAALSVICFHYNLTYGVPYDNWIISRTPLHLWWDGFAAVSLFFVLSGLVLSLAHFRRSAAPTLENFCYSGFLVSRLCRILLPYLAVLLLSAIAWHYSAQHLPFGPPRSSWCMGLWLERPTLPVLLRQANLFQIHGRFALIPQAWSLAVEIVLSLLVPLGVLVAGRNVIWLLAGTAIMSMLGGLSEYSVHFAIGIALAKYYTQIVAWLELRAGWRGGLTFLGLIVYGWRYLLPRQSLLHHGNADWHLEAIGAACLLMIASGSPRLRAFLSRGIIHHIGRISYSLYLCHLAILLTLTPRFMGAVSHHMRLHWLILWMLGLIFTCIISIGVADLLYRFVEVPTILIGRWLSTKTGNLFAPPKIAANMAG